MEDPIVKTRENVALTSRKEKFRSRDPELIGRRRGKKVDVEFQAGKRLAGGQKRC